MDAYKAYVLYVIIKYSITRDVLLGTGGENLIRGVFGDRPTLPRTHPSVGA